MPEMSSGVPVPLVLSAIRVLSRSVEDGSKRSSRRHSPASRVVGDGGVGDSQDAHYVVDAAADAAERPSCRRWWSW